jgi:hypothetical protein
MKKIFCIISVISLILASCSSDIFDNIKEYATSEKVYVGKLDKADGYAGYNRVEIDLLDAGRIPQDQINIGKAVQTVVEYDKEKIVFEGVRSWVNITNLTEPKLYRFNIYNIDEYGNKSIPVTVAVIPFTDADREVLAVADPMFTVSPSSVEFYWIPSLSSSFFDCVSITYTYIDKNGTVRTFTGDKIQMVDLPDGRTTDVDVVYTIIPKLDNERIIDTLTLAESYTVATNSLEEYMASRTPRIVQDPFLDGTQGKLTWGPATDHAVWSEIRYTKNSGEKEVVRTLANESLADCPDVKPGEFFETRTAFTPPGAPEEFLTPWVTSDVPFLTVISGDYTVLTTSYRQVIDGGAISSSEFSVAPIKITITATGPGEYLISDLFGGFYEIGRDYNIIDNGIGMRPAGHFKFNGTDCSLIDAERDYWGYGFDAITGTYDEATKTFSLQVYWAGSYVFQLYIQKN